MKAFNCLFSGLLLFAALSCTCSPKVLTYSDAERAFISSLTADDSLVVAVMGDMFMSGLKAGDLDSTLAVLKVVEHNVLYAISDQTVSELKVRFESMPVVDYELTRLTFSTEGVNDMVYRYSFSGSLADSPAIKFVLNPVKVEGRWYLTLKDAYQNSKDLNEKDQTHPLAPAPSPIKLHRQ